MTNQRIMVVYRDRDRVWLNILAEDAGAKKTYQRLSQSRVIDEPLKAETTQWILDTLFMQSYGRDCLHKTKDPDASSLRKVMVPLLALAKKQDLTFTCIVPRGYNKDTTHKRYVFRHGGNFRVMEVKYDAQKKDWRLSFGLLNQTDPNTQVSAFCKTMTDCKIRAYLLNGFISHSTYVRVVEADPSLATLVFFEMVRAAVGAYTHCFPDSMTLKTSAVSKGLCFNIRHKLRNIWREVAVDPIGHQYSFLPPETSVAQTIPDITRHPGKSWNTLRVGDFYVAMLEGTKIPNPIDVLAAVLKKAGKERQCDVIEVMQLNKMTLSAKLERHKDRRVLHAKFELVPTTADWVYSTGVERAHRNLPVTAAMFTTPGLTKSLINKFIPAMLRRVD